MTADSNFEDTGRKVVVAPVRLAWLCVYSRIPDIAKPDGSYRLLPKQFRRGQKWLFNALRRSP
jgi:hypothetical protein